ncbi:hypothetical protein CPB97_007322 [Podila verticillata]|nr:hypothetical protein CPB97_007322 [Podila verticillata]
MISMIPTHSESSSSSMSSGGIIGIVVAAIRHRRTIDGAGQVMFNPVGLDLDEKYYGNGGGGGSDGSGHGSASDSVLGGVTAVSGVSATAGGQTAGIGYSDSGYHPDMVSYRPPIEPSFAHYGYDQYDSEYLARREEEDAYMHHQQEQLYQQYQEQMAEHSSGEGMVGGPVSYYPTAAQLRYQQRQQELGSEMYGAQDYSDYIHLYHLTHDDMAQDTAASVVASAPIFGTNVQSVGSPTSPHSHTTAAASSPVSTAVLLTNRVSMTDSEGSVQNGKNEPWPSPRRGPQIFVPGN